jgi:xylan 1,4-beta-xylosidase
MITQLATYGKPMIVIVMGAGQIDSTPLLSNSNISAILWGGYPGQSGGTALFDIVTGKYAPAGRLSTTQYPADYIAKVPVTDMSLRPGPKNPGRTYMWYSGTPVLPFGFGMHYTNFSASIPASAVKRSYAIGDLVNGCKGNMSSSGVKYMDKCPFASISVQVNNTGKMTSDYVTLGFLTGSFGPRPYPKKSLVNYQRLFNITGGSSQTATLNLTLGSLSRVDENGNRVLYPGDYSLQIDNEPLTSVNFTLTGSQSILDQWPQPPPTAAQNNSGDYFVGGYGSVPGQAPVQSSS